MKNPFFIAVVVIFHAIPVYGQVQGIQEIKVSEPIIGSTTIVYEDSDDHIRFLGIEIKDHTVLCQILIAVFLAIAFLQSGFDKIIDQDDFPKNTPGTMWGVFDEYLFETFLNINFLVGGKISNNPIKSVANPGKIKSKAAKASAAPEIIS